jgi:hypothetical protein
VEDNQSSQLNRKTVWAGYSCEVQTSCQNRMGWEKEILGPKENCEEEFELLQFK